MQESDGAAQLKNGIELFSEGLKHIGEEVPKKWSAIRDDLKKEADQQPYITLKRYLEIYDTHLEPNREKALHLSRYFHDLGVFLHFQDERLLVNTVILHNHWATEAVFKILDDETIKDRLGRFTVRDCGRLWTDSKYEEKHTELLALMVKFELCYLVHDTSPETWLATQLLTASKPEELEEWEDPDDLCLTYRYEFLPKGLVNRLMVRMNRFVKHPDLAWSSGVLFEKGNTELLVQIAVTGNEIVMCAHGPEAKALLSVISSDLDAINDSFEGLRNKISKWIPCICSECEAIHDDLSNCA